MTVRSTDRDGITKTTPASNLLTSTRSLRTSSWAPSPIFLSLPGPTVSAVVAVPSCSTFHFIFVASPLQIAGGKAGELENSNTSPRDGTGTLWCIRSTARGMRATDHARRLPWGRRMSTLWGPLAHLDPLVPMDCFGARFGVALRASSRGRRGALTRRRSRPTPATSSYLSGTYCPPLLVSLARPGSSCTPLCTRPSHHPRHSSAGLLPTSDATGYPPPQTS